MCDVLWELDLGKHADAFESNKIDGEVLRDLDNEGLRELGVATATERQKLKHAVQMIEACGQLRLSASAMERIRSSAANEEERDAVMIATWDAARVAAWLETTGTQQGVREKLLAAKVNGELLLHITNDDLKQLGITAMGDRVKLTKLIEAVRKQHFAALHAFFGTRVQPSSSSAKASTAASAETAPPAMDSSTLDTATMADAPPSEYKCPITLELMDQPVIAPDGHIYEKAAIERWLSEHKTSPMTGVPMAREPLLCKTLRSAIIAWKEKHPH